MGNPQRPLKIRRGQHRPTAESTNIKAIEHLIDTKVSDLQKQIRVLQSNAITTMVILGDIRNSALIASSSTESTKRRLEELLENIEASTSNIKEFIGAPQRVLEGNAMEVHVLQEEMNRLRTALIRENIDDLEGDEGDDIVENVSEGFDEYGEYDEADRYQDEVNARRRRR